MTKQSEAHRLPGNLPPEVIERHQQRRGEQISVGFNTPFIAVTGLDVVGRAREPSLLLAMQEVVTELVGDREAFAAL